MPAEWEPHEATWLGWPHNATDWPGKLDTIRWVYGEIVRRMGNPIHPWLVAEEDGQVLGYASTSPMRGRRAYRWSVETGIYLDAAAQGRGIGRQLLAAHLDLLEQQGFVTAMAGIALPNDASVALHEKLGFKLSGIERGVGFKFGEWVDVGRWQRDLAARTAEPSEPLTSAAVRPLG